MIGERVFYLVWWIFWAIVFRNSLVALFIAPIAAYHAGRLFSDWCDDHYRRLLKDAQEKQP